MSAEEYERYVALSVRCGMAEAKLRAAIAAMKRAGLDTAALEDEPREEPEGLRVRGIAGDEPDWHVGCTGCWRTIWHAERGRMEMEEPARPPLAECIWCPNGRPLAKFHPAGQLNHWERPE